MTLRPIVTRHLGAGHSQRGGLRFLAAPNVGPVWKSAATHTLTPDGTGPTIAWVGTWTGSGPYASSTVNSYMHGQFVGSEVELRMSGGTGAATVRVQVDGNTVADSLNLATYPAGAQTIAYTGLHAGVHNVKVTILSGTLTFHELRALESPHTWLNASSAAVTKTGTFSTSTDALFYGGNRTTTTTVGNTLSATYTGTGVSVQIYMRSNLDHTVDVSIDGAAFAPLLIRNGATNIGGVMLASGLASGEHTVAVRMNSTYTLMWVGGFAALTT